MRAILLVLVFLYHNPIVSQKATTYSKFLGDTILVDWATGVILVDDTFFIIGTNYNQVQSFQNFVIYKTNDTARQLKNFVYNRSSKYVSSGGSGSICYANDKSFFVGGTDLDKVKSKGLSYKFNKNIDTVFIKEYSLFDSLNAFLNVGELSNGNLIFCGATSKTSYQNQFDAWYIVTDTNGNIIWQKTFGCNDFDVGSSVAPYGGG